MKTKCSLATMNSWLVFFLTIILLGAIFASIWASQQYIIRKNHHEEIRSEIENLYYFLKKEPTNLELFTVLRDGDSVALSVWSNTLSTFDDKLKKYDTNLKKFEIDKGYNTFPEAKLIPSLKKILTTFLNFSTENQERVESAKAFDQAEFDQLKKNISEQLKQFIIEAKAYLFDLR